MVVVAYLPEAGDIIWLDFTPHRGHEQAGRRPAIVLSPKNYNVKTNLLICVPMTKQIKNYPFEVVVKTREIEGVALADQVKSLDWHLRNAQLISQVDTPVLQAIKHKIALLLSINASF